MNVSAFRGKFSVNCCKKLKKLLLAGQKMHLQRAMTSSPSVMACRHILSLCYCFLFSKWPEWITGGLGSLASQGMGCFSSRFIKFTSALAFVEMRTLCHKKYPLYPRGYSVTSLLLPAHPESHRWSTASQSSAPRHPCLPAP